MIVEINLKLRTEIIEVQIGNASSSEFSLGQQPNLREAKSIRKIEAFHVGQVTNSPSGKVVVNTAVFQKASLRLVNKDNVEFKHLTLISLSKFINGTSIDPVNVPQIDTEKSKIVVNNAAGVIAGEVFLLQVTYEK